MLQMDAVVALFRLHGDGMTDLQSTVATQIWMVLFEL